MGGRLQLFLRPYICCMCTEMNYSCIHETTRKPFSSTPTYGRNCSITTFLRGTIDLYNVYDVLPPSVSEHQRECSGHVPAVDHQLPLYRRVPLYSTLRNTRKTETCGIIITKVRRFRTSRTTSGAVTSRAASSRTTDTEKTRVTTILLHPQLPC